MVLPLTGRWGSYMHAFGRNWYPSDPPAGWTPTIISTGPTAQQPLEWLCWDGYWINKVAEMRQRGYHAARLSFKFQADSGEGSDVPILNYKWMDEVIALFKTRNVSVIPDCHNQGSGTNLAYDPIVRVQWLEFVNHYLAKPELRANIAALNLWNEPGISPDIDASYTQQIIQYYADLTHEIHSIDPTMKIIFPYWHTLRMPGPRWMRADEFINFTHSTIITGTNQSLFDEPNVVFDCLHPYYWENAWDNDGVKCLTPEEKAEWETNTRLAPCVAAFGANRCWAGETYAGDGLSPDDQDPTHPCHQDPHPYDWSLGKDCLQARWLIAIINKYVELGVGFQASGLWGDGAGQTRQELGLFNSNYTNGGEPPPPTKYVFDHWRINNVDYQKGPSSIQITGAVGQTVTAEAVYTPVSTPPPSQVPVWLLALGAVGLGSVIMLSGEK